MSKLRYLAFSLVVSAIFMLESLRLNEIAPINNMDFFETFSGESPEKLKFSECFISSANSQINNAKESVANPDIADVFLDKSKTPSAFIKAINDLVYWSNVLESDINTDGNGDWEFIVQCNPANKITITINLTQDKIDSSIIVESIQGLDSLIMFASYIYEEQQYSDRHGIFSEQ